MFALLLTLIAAPSLAADDPGLWTRQAVGFGGWPAGLISDTRVQYRTPMSRKEGSLMLNDTYAGAGGMVRVTPAFTEFGPRLSIAPVDVFDLDLQASRLQYFHPGIGLMQFGSDTQGGKLDDDRAALAGQDQGVTTGGWSFTASPTVKLAVGPLVAFSSWNVSYIALDQPEDTQAYVYEPFRDQLIEWEEVSIESQTAVLYKIMPGDDGPTLWTGATLRDRFNVNSDDASTAVGAVVVARPSTAPAVPRIVGQALFYAKDQDRVGTVPNLQMLAAWTFE